MLEIVILSLLYSVYGFTINNHFDRNLDSMNPSKRSMNPVAFGDISAKDSLMQNAILLFLAFVLSLIWFKELTVFIAILFANVTLYSYKFKSMPYLDLISHSIIIAGIVFIPILAITSINLQTIFGFALIALGISNVIELKNHIRDYEHDKKGKANTTVTRIGIKNSKIIMYASAAIFLASVFFVSITISWYMIILSLMLIVEIIHSVIRK